MKTIYTILLLLFFTEANAWQADVMIIKNDTIHPAKDTSVKQNAHNTIALSVSGGLSRLSFEHSTKNGIVNTENGYSFAAQLDYNLNKRSKDVYFSAGVAIVKASAYIREKNITQTTPEYLTKQFPFTAIGLSLSGNFNFRVTDKLSIQSQVSGVPIINIGDFAVNKHLSVALQLTGGVKFNRWMSGIRFFKPLGIYNTGIQHKNLYRLTCVMVTTGIEIGR